MVSRFSATARLDAMAQAPALPRGFELPLEPRLPRIGSIDQVAVEERAASLAKRSIKKEAKLWALETAVRMMDLTTLEGADTPGKVAALCSKAVRPGPGRPHDSLGRRGLRLPEPRSRGEGAARRHGGQGRLGLDVLPVRAGAARREARRRARRGRARRGRDRHGDRPRRVPLRSLREGLRRDRQGEGGLRRGAPEGDPRDRASSAPTTTCAALRCSRWPRARTSSRPRPARCRRGDAARLARHARGDPRRPRRDRPHRRLQARGRHPRREAGDPTPRARPRDARPGLAHARPAPLRRLVAPQRRADADPQAEDRRVPVASTTSRSTDERRREAPGPRPRPDRLDLRAGSRVDRHRPAAGAVRHLRRRRVARAGRDVRDAVARRPRSRSPRSRRPGRRTSTPPCRPRAARSRTAGRRCPARSARSTSSGSRASCRSGRASSPCSSR